MANKSHNAPLSAETKAAKKVVKEEAVKEPARKATAKEAAEDASAEEAVTEAAIKAAEDAEMELTKSKKNTASPYEKLAKEYAERYPSATAFHITTDMQVFLSNGLSNARNHQKTLGKGEVVTINIK